MKMLKNVVKKIADILGFTITMYIRIPVDKKQFITKSTPIMDEYITIENGLNQTHVAGSFPNYVLKRIEEIVPSSVKYSVETGCGKSTILFSNISGNHTVFALDDREYQ
jgi:hypothetical protein